MYCIYKVNTSGVLGCDVSVKFSGERRDGYTVMERGFKTREEAETRMRQMKAEQK